MNSHPNGDFPDRYWLEVREICQANYIMVANLLPWDWKHGMVDFTHWSCLEIDKWAAWQNDIQTYIKEKLVESPENIIFRELKRLGAGASDSKAMAYGAKQAKYVMIDVLNHKSLLSDSERAFADEYIYFLAEATNFFFVFGRNGWKLDTEN